MPRRTIPAPQPDPTEAYAARTPNGRLVIAHLDHNPQSPLHRALRTAHLTPEPPGPTDQD